MESTKEKYLGSIIKSQGFSLESFDDVKGKYSGYAVVYGNLDKQGDIVEKGALRDFVELFKSGKRQVPLLNEHNPSVVLSFNLDAIDEDNHGIMVSGSIDEGSKKEHKEIYKNFVKSYETGNAFLSGKFIENKIIDHSAKDYNGRPIANSQGLRYIIRKSSLAEVSYTTDPVNTLAEIQLLKSEKENFEFIKHITSFSRAEEFLRKNTDFTQSQCTEFLRAFQSAIEKRNSSPAQDCPAKEPAQVQSDLASFLGEVEKNLKK